MLSSSNPVRRYGNWIKHRMQVSLMLSKGRDSYEAKLASLPRITGPAIVAGSAPNPVSPAGVDATWFRISVNASQLVLENFGLPPPHLTIFQSQIKESHGNRDLYWEALRGRETGHVVFIVNSKNDGKIAAFLEQQHYSAGNITPLSHLVRKAVIADMTKRHVTSPAINERTVSNGMFAALLALKLGADKVVLSGFSLDPGWFHARDHATKRNHQKMDTLACQMIVQHELPVFSSDPTFASHTGLPLWHG